MENFIENKLTDSKKVITKILNYYSFIKSNINEKEQIVKIIEKIDNEDIKNYKAMKGIAFASKDIDLLKSNLQTLFKLYDTLETYMANIEYVINMFNSPDFILKNSVSSTYESEMIEILHELNIEYKKFKGMYKSIDGLFLNDIIDKILSNILLNLGTFINDDVNKLYINFIDFLNSIYHKHKGSIILYVKICQSLLDQFNKGEYGNIIIFKILNTINSDKDKILNSGDSSNIKNEEKKLHIQNPPLKRFNLLPASICLPIDEIIELINRNKPHEEPKHHKPHKPHKAPKHHKTDSSSSESSDSDSSSSGTSSGTSSESENEEVEDITEEHVDKYLKEINLSKYLNLNSKHKKHKKKYKGGKEKIINNKNQTLLNKTLNQDISKLEKYIKHKKISILLLERINFTPIEYDISNVISDNYKQPEEYGITENLIKRFLTTKPINNIKNTWKFSCDILGDYTNDKNKFFILETLNGLTYRIMSPWNEPTAFSIPYYLIQNIVEYFTETNKTTRASQYHDVMIKQAMNNMFYSKKLNMDAIENISSSFDSTSIKNEILIQTRNYCFTLLKSKIKKVKTNKDINDIMHSEKLYDIVIGSILSSFKKASEGINKEVFREDKFIQSEITLSFMVELNYISLQFLKNLHDLFNHEQLSSDVFELPNEKKLTQIEKTIETNLLNTINTLFGEDNIYEIINVKSFIINY